MATSIGGARKQNGGLGDKEAVAVRESYSSIYFESLAACSWNIDIRVWYVRVWSYCTRMVYKIVPYAYGIYHTCMV